MINLQVAPVYISKDTPKQRASRNQSLHQLHIWRYSRCAPIRRLFLFPLSFCCSWLSVLCRLCRQAMTLQETKTCRAAPKLKGARKRCAGGCASPQAPMVSGRAGRRASPPTAAANQNPPTAMTSVSTSLFSDPSLDCSCVIEQLNFSVDDK